MEQIFADVEIRHSSLILKEVLHTTSTSTSTLITTTMITTTNYQ